MASNTNGEWIGGRTAREMLGVGPLTLSRLAHKGFITTRRFPSCDPLYLRADIVRLVEQHTIPATRRTERPRPQPAA